MSLDKRKALGRGLGALLPELPTGGAGGGGGGRKDYLVVGIEEIHPSGQNPRMEFDDAKLGELADSIREHGLIQPLAVRARPTAEGGGFLIVAGERRWRAAQKAGLKQIPVVVKDVSPREAYEQAMVENLQRADLNPIEEAHGYRRMCDEFGYTQEQLAQRLGKDRTTILNALRLLKLPDPVQRTVAAGRLTAGHARALLGLDEAPAIERAADRVVARGLSVRQTEALVKQERLVGAPETPQLQDAPEAERSVQVRDLEARLQRSLGRRVRIVEKDKQSGKVELEYHSLDDFERLLERLLRP